MITCPVSRTRNGYKAYIHILGKPSKKVYSKNLDNIRSKFRKMGLYKLPGLKKLKTIEAWVSL